MSSNTPPPITPNTNTNDNVTPDHNHPPTVNVVTQASQLTQEFDPVSTPAQQRNRKDLRDSSLLTFKTSTSLDIRTPKARQ